MAIVVPAIPEFGKNFLPGLIKDPQPMMQPKAMAQTCIGESCFLSFGPLSVFDFVLRTVDAFPFLVFVAIDASYTS